MTSTWRAVLRLTTDVVDGGYPKSAEAEAVLLEVPGGGKMDERDLPEEFGAEALAVSSAIVGKADESIAAMGCLFGEEREAADA